MTMPHPSSLARRTALAGAAGFVLSQPARAELTPKVAIGKEGWLFPAWEDLRRTSLARSRQIGDVVSIAASLLRKAGIETVVLMTPMKARIYGEFLPDDFQPNADWARRYDQLAEDWRRGDIVVPDLAAFFTAKRKAQPELLYFKADIHWTPLAADLAAIETARLIRERKWLAKSDKPGLKLGAPFTMKYANNDLAALLPPAETGKYPFQTIRLRRPIAAKAGLLDDEAGDVVVLGNSYMQTDYTFPTVLSNQLERPVSLLWKPARSPYAMMLDYLQGPLAKQTKPRVIVWHMMEGNMELAPDDTGFWNSGAMTASAFHSQLRQALSGV
jgi:alginate O-acetyltransferase complex protein AlgJ